MGRRPIGDHAMTPAERKARQVQKQVEQQLERRLQEIPRAPRLDGVPITIEHLRLDPKRYAPFLARRLGRDTAIVFRDEFSRAIEELPASPPD